MDFDPACVRAQAGRRSSVAAPRAVTNSLPKRQEFVSLRSAFSSVYRSGVRSSRGGVLVLQDEGDPGQPQVGFVAGRKVGNAVKRNRAKRRVREAMRRTHLQDGTAYIVVASPDVLDAEFTTLVVWLDEAIEANRMKSSRKKP